jgi:hypothetical protein
MMKQTLIPAGFIERGSLYVRKQDDQIQGVHFQRAQFVRDYYVNFALHYDFLPGVFKFEPKPFDQFELLDFVFRNRIEYFHSRPRSEAWWPCDDDELTVRERLVEQANFALESFESFRKKWPNPMLFLDAMPPDAFEKAIAEGDETPGESVAWRVLPEWQPDASDIYFLLCVLACRARKRSLAERYSKIALGESARRTAKEAIRTMLWQYGRSCVRKPPKR